MKQNIIAVLVLLFIVSGIASAQSYKIIVNNSNSASSLSKKEVSDLFLKKTTKWSSGTAAVPVDLAANSSVREAFSTNIHGKAVSAIRNYWQQAAFSGSATAPPEKSNDAEVIAFVKKTPGAIGYISSGASADGVKTISVN